jgi:S-adenosylmethionine/arginine decarboxylase-like enzyme
MKQMNMISKRNNFFIKKLNTYNFNSSNYWGMSTSLDFKDCNDRIKNKEQIQKYVYILCKLIDMKRFGECQVVHFGEDEKVAGYSMVQLIETSLISGHFANKSNSAYIDIFSCKPYDVDKVIRYTSHFFGSDKMIYNVNYRV